MNLYEFVCIHHLREELQVMNANKRWWKFAVMCSYIRLCLLVMLKEMNHHHE